MVLHYGRGESEGGKEEGQLRKRLRCQKLQPITYTLVRESLTDPVVVVEHLPPRLESLLQAGGRGGGGRREGGRRGGGGWLMLHPSFVVFVLAREDEAAQAEAAEAAAVVLGVGIARSDADCGKEREGKRYGEFTLDVFVEFRFQRHLCVAFSVSK